MENRFTDYYRLGGIAGIKYGERQFETDIQRSLCVNPSKKLIYYKPGKAAGTSIFRTILQPMGGWIIQKDNPIEFAEWIDNITDDEIQKYFSFIFVRNPFSRIVSSWNDTDRVRYPKFKDFVKEGAFNDGIPTEIHYQTQSSLIETPDSEVSNINFIGKVENIDEDWKELCSLANIPYVPMVHAKSRNYEHYTSFYDEETVSIVTEMYQRDLDIFNYKFLEDKVEYYEHSEQHGKMKDLIRGSEIRHIQFTEFSEGHGSIFGTLNDGKKFKLHITELIKMMDEFNFSVYKGSGDVLNATLKINWESTKQLKKTKDFTYKADLKEYKKDGNMPNKVNYVAKVGYGKDTKFVEHRTGPYYSGQLVITNPEDVKDIF